MSEKNKSDLEYEVSIKQESIHEIAPNEPVEDWRAWLVVVGCFCVIYIHIQIY